MKLQEFMEAETQGSFEHAAKRQKTKEAVKRTLSNHRKSKRNAMT